MVGLGHPCISYKL
jgi:hypothetical protein